MPSTSAQFRSTDQPTAISPSQPFENNGEINATQAFSVNQNSSHSSDSKSFVSIEDQEILHTECDLGFSNDFRYFTDVSDTEILSDSDIPMLCDIFL